MRQTIVAVCCLAFAGCSSFQVIEPADGAVITQPAATRITFEGKPQITHARVTDNTTDITAQGAMVGSDRWQANLNLPAGRHAIGIEADVPCSYCTGGSFKHTSVQNICVVAPRALTHVFKTPLAQGDSQTWAAVDERTIAIEPDAPSPRQRWNFIRLGGFASSDGLIESAAFPCRCLRSMDDQQRTPIGFYACNANDTFQQWQALPLPPGGSNRWRIQNRGRGVSSACLTEGPASDRRLIQKDCNDTPDQVWSVRDNGTMQLGSPF